MMISWWILDDFMMTSWWFQDVSHLNNSRQRGAIERFQPTGLSTSIPLLPQLLKTAGYCHHHYSHHCRHWHHSRHHPIGTTTFALIYFSSNIFILSISMAHNQPSFKTMITPGTRHTPLGNGIWDSAMKDIFPQGFFFIILSYILMIKPPHKVGSSSLKICLQIQASYGEALTKDKSQK